MKPTPDFVPTSSQTVGPYFRIGLDYLLDRMPAEHRGAECVEIRGQIRDRDGVPVPDALLEFWGVSRLGSDGGIDTGSNARGFKRAPSDEQGRFSVLLRRPNPTALEDGRIQAPHVLVLVFMRGLLRHLVTRLYFADSPENAADPLLQEVSAARRDTLVAQPDGADAYRWDIVTQGNSETVFFAW